MGGAFLDPFSWDKTGDCSSTPKALYYPTAFVGCLSMFFPFLISDFWRGSRGGGRLSLYIPLPPSPPLVLSCQLGPTSSSSYPYPASANADRGRSERRHKQTRPGRHSLCPVPRRTERNNMAGIAPRGAPKLQINANPFLLSHVRYTYAPGLREERIRCYIMSRISC